MPPKRAYRKKAPAYRARRKFVYRKRRIMRKRQNNPSKMTFKPRKQLGLAFPERYLTKVKGTLLLNTAASSGALSYQVYGNSITDFGAGLSSENVSGFSSLAAIYNKCIVYGSKIKVNFANSTTTPKYVILWPQPDSSSTPSNIRAMMDQPYSKSRQVSANTGQGKAFLTQYIASKRIFALKDLKDNEDLVFGLSTPSTPIKAWSWYFRIDNGTGSGTDADLTKIEIVYYIECFERVTLNQS